MKFPTLIRVSILLISLIAYGCSLTKLQDKGEVENSTFHHKMEFSTAKSLILIPVEIDGQTKNFIFDTGADLTLIQSDTLLGKATKVSGASNRKMEVGQHVVPSIKIGDINFQNTHALNGDLKGLNEQIPNFGGLIGQPIIRKANWLINYPMKSLEISNSSLADSSFQRLEIKMENGSPYTFINIDGKSYKAMIDLGSTSSLSVPQDSKLAQILIDKYKFEENERDIYTIGGRQLVKEKVGTVPNLRIGDIAFENVQTDIRNSSGLRVGMRFFEYCILYVDSAEGGFKIKM